jgi:hypothetical protein
MFSRYLSIPAVIFNTEMAEGGENRLLAGLNPNAAPFNMDSLIAAAVGIQRDCCLPDLVIEKPEAWLKCVEAQFEDAKVVKSKEKYSKVMGKLPVHIIEELALVTDNPSAFEDPYTELKQHLLAAFGRCKWEKLDSLLNFPKMGPTSSCWWCWRASTPSSSTWPSTYRCCLMGTTSISGGASSRLRRSWRPWRMAYGR